MGTSMTSRKSKVRLPAFDNGNLRTISVTDSGPPDSKDIYVCLPGLLETQRTFDTFASLVEKNNRVITFDYAGRGESDPLPSRQPYKMSSCLTDIATVVSYIIGFEVSINEKRGLPENDFSRKKSSVHLVGNSMGGLLAVVFTANYPNVVSSIILNDVGAILPWSGLVSLIGIIGTNAVFNVEGTIRIGPKFLARDLNVDPRLVVSVLKPTYADLLFEKTSFGLSFEQHFSKIKSPILVIHSEESQLVNWKVIESMLLVDPKPEFIAICGKEHPVFYTENLIEKILTFAEKNTRTREFAAS
jgi:pimeloyl-ACP methyl ester carboxylesterase